MSVGLPSYEVSSIAAPLIGAIISTLVYLFAYDKSEHATIASDAESARWKETKKLYAEIVSGHYNAISDSANHYASDLEDPDSAEDVIEELVTEPTPFQELRDTINQMNEPKKYNSRCRSGAQYAPWAFTCSIVAFLLALMADGIAIAIFAVGGILFLTGTALTILFLYYRWRIDALSDEITFRT